MVRISCSQVPKFNSMRYIIKMTTPTCQVVSNPLAQQIGLRHKSNPILFYYETPNFYHNFDLGMIFYCQAQPQTQLNPKQGLRLALVLIYPATPTIKFNLKDQR